MRVTLLGFTVPTSLLEWINQNDVNLASQTHRFAWGLVSALRSAGCDVDLLSSAPVSDYPRNPRLWWSGGKFESHGTRGRMIPFVNALGFKHLSRTISAFAIGTREIRRHRPAWLLVHGVHSPFLWFGVWCQRWLGVSTCVVLTDPPGVVLQSDGCGRRVLKRLDIGLTKQALSRVSAVVVLAQPLADDFAPNVRAMVMEGLFDESAWTQVSTPDPSEHTFDITYAGGLSSEYGVKDLVDAVREWHDPRVRLHLFGRGPLEDWISQQAEGDGRISSAKLLPPEELAAVYARSDVLVQPRPEGQDFVAYSFPSKLIEYMASGTPVVSTRLSSIPEDYEGHVSWAASGATGIRHALMQVAVMDPARRHRMGTDAREFVLRTRTAAAQGRRLRAFLDGIDARTAPGSFDL